MWLNLWRSQIAVARSSRYCPRSFSSKAQVANHSRRALASGATSALDMEELLTLRVSLREEIDRFAAMKPNPMSIRCLLEMSEPARIAKFVCTEVPIRYAERIRSLETLEDWDRIPELVDVHERHVRTFRDMRLWYEVIRDDELVADAERLQDFMELVLESAQNQADVQLQVSKAMYALRNERGNVFTQSFVNSWLDDFLLNWIGTNMFLGQCVACGYGSPTGIIDANCDVTQICQEVCDQLMAACKDFYNRHPVLVVESYSAACHDEGAPLISYIPDFLKYVLMEILKNSCRATLEKHTTPQKLKESPIRVIVSADHHQVVIRISDKAHGIPFEFENKIWDYTFTTVKKKSDGNDFTEGATPLAGFGVGLPLSRQYVRYLGGSIHLSSCPGYGTEVFLRLPRVDADLVEVVPDEDN